jgi:aspartyl-tRNA(Asn)/glutamyl-tRNA(Gln) amidotransferase subunit B
MKEYGFDEKQTEILVSEPAFANYFEEAVSELKEQAPDTSCQLLYNYLTTDLWGLMKQTGTDFADLKIVPEHLAHLAALISAEKVTSRQAKDILARMFETGADPTEIVASENIGISSDMGEIEAVVTAVIAENETAVHDYKKGKTASLQFLIGKAMSKLKGRARPDMLTDIFKRMLESE